MGAGRIDLGAAQPLNAAQQTRLSTARSITPDKDDSSKHDKGASSARRKIAPRSAPPRGCTAPRCSTPYDTELPCPTPAERRLRRDTRGISPRVDLPPPDMGPTVFNLRTTSVAVAGRPEHREERRRLRRAAVHQPVVLTRHVGRSPGLNWKRNASASSGSVTIASSEGKRLSTAKFWDVDTKKARQTAGAFRPFDAHREFHHARGPAGVDVVAAASSAVAMAWRP